MHQKTLNRSITLHGKGLHSGRFVRLEVHPANADHGIVFLRTDNVFAQPLKAIPDNISSTDLCTTIGKGDFSVSTIEHLMAAFVGTGIDNALVKINAPEIPIMDGSSLPFVKAFQSVGVKRLPRTRKQIIVKKAFELRNGDRFIRVEPSSETSFECSVDYTHKVIGKQSIVFKPSEASYQELFSARTFCHVNEVNAMRQAGLAQGGSLENAIVVSDTGILNQDGLRYPDEFVRHKLLDCLGDLAILGADLIAKVITHKPGHGLHAQFMVELLKQGSSVIEVHASQPASIKKAVDYDHQEDEGFVFVGGIATVG